MITLHKTFYSTPAVQVGWYDADETIFLLEILQQWTWEELVAGIEAMNAVSRALDRPTYGIFVPHRFADAIPKGETMFRELGRLMTHDYAHEQLTFLVGTSDLARVVLRTTARAYNLGHVFAKYRFVASLDDALAEIEQHRGSAQEG
jgi:hypothetical protein